MPFNALTDSRKKVLLILGVSRACSDVGGTTLCNDGDHCLYLQDLSGNGYHAVQNGSQPGPIYHASGLGGQPYLDFTGTDGKSLAITPDSTLNGIQATHDFTLYGHGTAGAATIPVNGVAKFVSQCDDAVFSGVLDLQFSNTTLQGGPNHQAAQVQLDGTGFTRLFYVPANGYSRWGFSENSIDFWRMFWGGIPATGLGSLTPPAETPNTTGNIILGAKFYTTWSDWRPWQGQWHGLCYYAPSLTPAEVWQLDQYLIGLRSQVHAVHTQPYLLVWDGNSHAAINSFLVPDVIGLLSLDVNVVANFAWHFKTTSQMITLGGEIDDLIVQLRLADPGKRVVVAFDELTNDFGSYTAAQLYAHYQTYGAARLAAGANAIVAATMLDQQVLSGPDETKRAALNTLVRGNTVPFWRVADWASSPNLEPWNGTYYADTLHPNDLGNTDAAPYYATPIAAAALAPAGAAVVLYRNRRAS